MASPKVSLQQRCYLGRWNMRLPSDGEIPLGSPNIKRLNLWRLPRNIQAWIVCSYESWRTRMSYCHFFSRNKSVKPIKICRKLMIVSWQVPKFKCSSAAIKGNGIWDRLRMRENQHSKAYFVTFAKEYTNMESLLLIRQKDSDVPPSYGNTLTAYHLINVWCNAEILPSSTAAKIVYRLNSNNNFGQTMHTRGHAYYQNHTIMVLVLKYVF